MNNFIQKLHQKSESKRRAYAFGTSLVVTSLIFMVWFSVKFSSFSNDIIATQNAAKETIVTPINTFGKMTASALDSLKGSFGGIKDSVDNLSNTVKSQYEAQTVNTYTTSQ